METLPLRRAMATVLIAALVPAVEPPGPAATVADPRGDGLATEVLGDLDTAVRVVVLVPGVDSTLAAFERGHGGVARRAPAVQARWLAEEIRAGQRGARIAVVAWLGYDPPEGLGL